MSDLNAILSELTVNTPGMFFLNNGPDGEALLIAQIPEAGSTVNASKQVVVLNIVTEETLRGYFSFVTAEPAVLRAPTFYPEAAVEVAPVVEPTPEPAPVVAFSPVGNI